MRVEKTATGAAMMRALEQYAPEPLLSDPLAARFVTGWAGAVLRRGPLRRLFLRVLERIGPGMHGAVVCRTRVIDDECRAALAAGVEQVVILGAGMDTRAHRLPGMAAVPVHELDLPQVQRLKRAVVPAAGHVT